jgi:hypothetical protein
VPLKSEDPDDLGAELSLSLAIPRRMNKEKEDIIEPQEIRDGTDL